MKKKMKPTIGKQQNVIITSLLLLLIIFIALFFIYTERLGGFLSFSFRSNLNFKPSPSEESNNNKKAQVVHEEEVIKSTRIIDECDFGNGKWVFEQSIKPLYSDTSCPYISRPFSCVKNGRLDSDYLHWKWQPQHCNLPKFDAEVALKRLKGKRLLFVGDSLQQDQWESFICLVEWIIPLNQKSMKRGIHSVFTAMEYNATIEFYWAPMLVESNSDSFEVKDPKKRIVKVDSIMEHAKNWIGVDFLVFYTYIWWIDSSTVKAIRGSFANGEEGYEELDTKVAYNLGLRTWANWVDSTINPNKTRVFFTTMSPTHTKSEDWGNKDGVKCFNETKPVMRKNHWGSGSDKGIMNVVSKVVKGMKVQVTFINITQISEYRIDAHPSIWGNLLTHEERANPKNADCFHWCLPGVPDTWNQIFLSML